MDQILHTVLLLNPVYVALFWAIVLHMRTVERNVPRMFLGRAMIVIFILFVSQFFFFKRMSGFYIWLDCFYNLASLSLYPMYYVYARLLTTDGELSFRVHARYFAIPVAIFIAMAGGYIAMDYEEGWIYVTEVLYGDHKGTGIIAFMYRLYILERVVFIVQMVFYVVLTSITITRHHRQLNDAYSSTEGLSLRWVQVFNIILLLTSTGSAFAIGLGRENLINSNLIISILSAGFSVLLFGMGVMANRQNAVIIKKEEKKKEGPVAEDKSPPKLREDLIALFERDKAYLDKDLTIWDVSEKLGTNRTYVSRVINHEFGQTFTTFVNNYRSDHAKNLIAGSNSLSFEEIADMSGFGSVQSLYRAFQNRERMSVSEYRRRLRSGEIKS